MVKMVNGEWKMGLKDGKAGKYAGAFLSERGFWGIG